MSASALLTSAQSPNGQYILVVSEKGFELRTLQIDANDDANVQFEVKMKLDDVEDAVWTADGSMFATLVASAAGNGGSSVTIYDVATLAIIQTFQDKRQIRRIALSPRGSFLIYCVARDSAEATNNFYCYQIGIPTGAIDATSPAHSGHIFNWPLKDYGQNWPACEFSKYETFFARRLEDGVGVYLMPKTIQDGPCPVSSGICAQGTVERPPAGTAIASSDQFCHFPTERGPLCFSLSPELFEVDGPKLKEVTEDPIISRADPERSAFAAVAIYSHVKKGPNGHGILFTASTRRPDYKISAAAIRATGGKLCFTDDGSSAVFEAYVQQSKEQSAVSYYSESTLHVVGANAMRKIDVVNALKTPVHSYHCRPGMAQLMVSYGPLPAKLRLIDTKNGREVGDFGENRRNHFRFSPASNWLIMGGYGSLNGDTEIYDLNTGDVIGASKFINNVVAEWLPDGRHLVLATTSPRLRVDNQLMVIRYNCEVLHREPFERLTVVRPQPVTLFRAQLSFPPSPATHVPQKNEIEGKATYIPPSQRRKMEEEAAKNEKKKGKGKGKAQIKQIKVQGGKAKMADTGIPRGAPSNPKADEAPKIGFKLPF